MSGCRVASRRGRRQRHRPVIQPPYRLRQRQPLHPPHEVQHVAAGPAAEAVIALAVAVHREAPFRLLVKGTHSLPHSPLAVQDNPGSLHRVAQGVPRLEFRDVHLVRSRYDHDAPPFRLCRDFSPRRLRRETGLPTGQRIPRTAATSRPPSSRSNSAAALPVAGL